MIELAKNTLLLRNKTIGIHEFKKRFFTSRSILRQDWFIITRDKDDQVLLKFKSSGGFP
jgi:hypothetical protein